MRREALRMLLLCTSLIGLLEGCYYDVEEELYPGFCDTEQLNYVDDIKPFLELHCNAPACHVQGGGGIGIFTDYAGIKAKVDDGTVESAVFVLGSMPQGGTLTTCEKDRLRAWIDAGAPEF